MDSKHNIECNFCNAHTVNRYCEFCQVNLCNICIGEHTGDEYERHKIVPFHHRKTILIYPECTTHCNKMCELKCQQCSQYICTFCLASEDHKGHVFIVLEYIYKAMKQDIKTDTEDLQNVLFPNYDESRNELEKEIAILGERYERLKQKYQSKERNSTQKLKASSIKCIMMY